MKTNREIATRRLMNGHTLRPSMNICSDICCAVKGGGLIDDLAMCEMCGMIASWTTMSQHGYDGKPGGKVRCANGYGCHDEWFRFTEIVRPDGSTILVRID